VKLPNAYYRAYFPASPDNLAATSKLEHQWRYLTRIVSLSVSPRSVHRHGQITVSGRLERQAGRGWRSYSGRRILIVLRPRGSKTWYWIHKVTTNSRGYFSKTFADPVSAHWSAAYEGDPTHFASSGAIYYVSVTAAAAARSVNALPSLPSVTMPAGTMLAAPGDRTGDRDRPPGKRWLP
jgi:hypothetical protein